MNSRHTKRKMKSFGIFSIVVVLISTVLASESGDLNNLLEEKAKIKAEAEINNAKPTPGQLIHVGPNVSAKAPAATKVEAAEIISKPTVDPKPRKSKKDDHKDDNEDETADEDEKNTKKQGKDVPKPGKKGKKSSNSFVSEDDSGDSNELPKRLFRPRFRANNSAYAVKVFSSSTLFITLSVTFAAFFFI